MFKDRAFIGLIFSAFLIMVGVGASVALLPQRIIDITGSTVLVGYLAFAFAISYLIFQIPIGNLSDKYGFKRFLILGYLLCFVAGVIFYFSKSSFFIFLGRFIQGAGEAPIWALVPALLSIKYPLNKGKFMGIYNSAIHLGLALGPLFGILLFKNGFGNEAFLFYAGFCFIGFLIIYFSVKDLPLKQKDTRKTRIKDVFKLINDKILITLIGIFLYGAAYGSFITIFPAFLIDVKNFNQILIGIFFSLFYISITISQFVIGPLSDKWGYKNFMILGLFITTLGIMIFPLVSNILIFVFVIVISIGLGIFYIASMTFLHESTPVHFKCTISGVYYLFWGLGYSFGPILIGTIGNILGLTKSFFIFSFFFFVETLIIAFYLKENKRMALNS